MFQLCLTADSGRPLNANSCRVNFNGCTMTFLGRFSDVSKAWLQCLFSKFKRCNLQLLRTTVKTNATTIRI